MTRVISGFPGVGKSHVARENKSLRIVDSDSSEYSWLSPGVRNPEFPTNYMIHLLSLIALKFHDVIFVSSHKTVRDAMMKEGIAFTLVYPDYHLKDRYLTRYRDRGSDEAFVEMMNENWYNFLDECYALNADAPNGVTFEKLNSGTDFLTI